MVHKIIYHYDEKGLLIKQTDHDEKNIITSTTLYEYDIISNLPLNITTGKHITSFEYNFDMHNN